MTFILLLLSIAGYVIIMLGMGSLSKNLFRNTADQMYFQLFRNTLCFLLMALIYRALLPSGLTLLLAFGMGMACLVSSVFNLVSYAKGPISLSVLIISSLSMIIASVAGPIFWGEPISILQIIGILLSVASMALLTEPSLVKETSFGWIISMLLAGIGGGLQGPMQKALANSSCAGETNEFITYSFLFSAIATLILLLYFRVKKQEKVTYKMDLKIFGLFMVQVFLSIFLNINNLKLVAELPTVIFFPAYSIGGLLLVTVASVFLFNEQMSTRQKVGFGTGIVALLLISGVLESL